MDSVQGIFIDGYNILLKHPKLSQVCRLKGIQIGREQLISKIRNEKIMRSKEVCLVFDGQKGGTATGDYERIGNLKIYYTKLGE